MPDDAHNAELSEFRRAQRRHRLKLAAIVTAIVAVVAMLPALLGLGPLAWRLFRYESVTLYFVNVTGGDVTIEIGSRSEQFAGGQVHDMTFLAGDVELSAYRADGSLIESHRFYTDNRDVFFNLGGAYCFVVLDAAGLYAEGADASRVTVMERLDRDDRIYVLPEAVVVPPRGIVPEQIAEGRRLVWIEDVACELLDPPEEHLLIGQQIIRMEGRREVRRQREVERRRQLGQ